MRKLPSLLTALILLAALIAYIAGAAEQGDQEAGPIFLKGISPGYRDLSLISVSRLTAGNSSSQLRAEPGNDVAIRLIAKGNFAFSTAISDL